MTTPGSTTIQGRPVSLGIINCPGCDGNHLRFSETFIRHREDLPHHDVLHRGVASLSLDYVSSQGGIVITAPANAGVSWVIFISVSQDPKCQALPNSESLYSPNSESLYSPAQTARILRHASQCDAHTCRAREREDCADGGEIRGLLLEFARLLGVGESGR